MKKRLRRGLALMLSAALALSMNVTAFADEVQEDAFETAGAEAEEAQSPIPNPHISSKNKLKYIF